MSEFIKIPAKELKELKKRIKTLSQEKAQLQLLYELIRELSLGSDLQNTLKNILHMLMNTIGGTNLTIYYQLDEQWYSYDIGGAVSKYTELDDPLVKKAAEEKTFFEGSESDSLMIGPEAKFLPTVRSWIYPLVVSERVIGVIKLEGIRIAFNRNVRNQLQIFINYISLILQNELMNYSKLKIAFDKVREYSATLEQKVKDRTRELEEKNRELEQFNRLFIDREFRIKELRDRIKELEIKK